MRKLSIREMHKKLGRLDRLVQDEGELLVTRRGVPIARVVPLRANDLRPDHAELRSTMPTLEMASEVLIRNDRDHR